MHERPAPQPEPEIIPPGAPLPNGSRIWVSTGAPGTHRVYTGRVGPLGVFLLALAIGGAAVVAFIVLLGAALISLTVIGVLVVAAVIAGILRGPFQRLR